MLVLSLVPCVTEKKRKNVESLTIPLKGFCLWLIFFLIGDHLMMIFDDKVGGWGWQNAGVSKKYTKKRTLFNSSD
jgi:hypothetical protein